MQLPAPKDKIVTGAYCKNVVLKKLKAHFKRRRPKAGLKYLRLLHDNAPAHKARIVTDFLESEKVNVLPNSPFSPDLAICNYFLLPKLKFYLSGKRYQSRDAIGSAVYQLLMGVPNQDYERCFQNWIDCLKRRIGAGGEYFKGQRKSNEASDRIFEAPFVASSKKTSSKIFKL